MKKKILAVVTAAVLALGCASAAFAAKDDFKWDSNTMSTAYDENKFVAAGCYTVADDVQVKVLPVRNTDFAADKQVADLEKAKAFMFNTLKDFAGVSQNNKILAIFNVDYEPDEDEGTEMVFVVNGIKAGDKISMYHWNNKILDWESGSNWVITKVTKDHIYARVKKLSPVAFVKDAKKNTSTSSGSSESKTATGTTGSKVAPKTGEV